MWIRPVEILSVLIAIQKKFGRKKIAQSWFHPYHFDEIRPKFEERWVWSGPDISRDAGNEKMGFVPVGQA